MITKEEFERHERKHCKAKNTCNASCTTCPIDSNVVESWQDHLKGE